MKLPWKLLASLVSRRRPEDAPANPVENIAELEASKGDARQMPALLSAWAEVEHDEKATPGDGAPITSGESKRDPDAARREARSYDNDDIRTPARPEASPPDGDVPLTLPSRQARERSPRLGGSKRNRTEALPQSTDVANNDQFAEPLTSVESFFEEVASLDEEIRQLKRQLAQKLHLQNGQLIKLLERFERR